jgi:hypothetical protein
MSELNIYQRINAVMKEVEYVRKDAKVQGYSAVTHDMVTAVLRGSMVKHGIVVQLEQKSSEILERRDKAAGVAMMLYAGTYDVHFVNIDKPEERATITLDAHAADNGDKAPGKCASYATKHAMLKLFSLETGENDESRVEGQKLITDIQAASIKKGLGGDDERIVKFCEAYQVENVESMPKSSYDSAMARIKKSNEAKP